MATTSDTLSKPINYKLLKDVNISFEHISYSTKVGLFKRCKYCAIFFYKIYVVINEKSHCFIR